MKIAADPNPACRNVIENPSREELRELAAHHESTTEYGSAAFVTEARSRTAEATRTTVDGEVTEEDLDTVDRVHEYLEDAELIRLDRKIGTEKRYGSYHCRLYVTKEFARLALMFAGSLEPAEDPDADPDFVTIDVPEWPGDRAILVDTESGATYVLNSDYFGEIKKSFLRQTMYRAKQEGHLGLHAGSKVVRARSAESGKLRDRGYLFFGLSGTGKTSLTCHDYDMDTDEGELVRVRQDDVVVLTEDAFCKGTEGGGFYIKTDGLSPDDQEALYQAAISSRALMENVWVEDDGTVDFFNSKLTKNGRAIVPIDEVKNTDDTIDVPEITDIFFITRNPLVPAVGRLTPEQAAVAFMLGESIKTSAADPDAKGEPVRVVGTNPFIVGAEGEEGDIFHDILVENPDLHCYILNTGRIGEGEQAADVRIQDTVAILRAIAREAVEWSHDETVGFQVPESVPHVAPSKFRLRDHYEQDELERKLGELRGQRREWLNRFPKFPDHLAEALY